MSHSHVQPFFLYAGLGLLSASALVDAKEQTANEVYTLNPVVITATRQAQPVSQLAADITVIDAAAIQQAGNTSLLNLLARQSAIEVTQQGGSRGVAGLFIRGSDAQQVLLLIDGMRVGSASLGSASAVWPNFSLQQIERIEIIRGAASALYGSDAIGGVIQIFTKQPKQADWFVEVGAGSFSQRQWTAGMSQQHVDPTLGTLRYQAQIGEQSSHEISVIASNPAILNNNDDRDGYKSRQGSLSLSYEPSVNHSFAFNFMQDSGWSRYDSAPSRYLPWDDSWKDDWKTSTKQQVWSLVAKNKFTDSWLSTLRFGQNIDRSQELDNGTISSSINSTQNLLQWQNDVKLGFADGLLAFESLRQEVDGSTSLQENSRTINSAQIGLSSSAVKDVKAHPFYWQVHGRYDDNSQFGSAKTGALAVGYHLNKHWRINGSVAKGFKAPSMNDLYWPDDTYVRGNPNLRPEKSRNEELSVRYEDGIINSSLTAFNSDLTDLIAWQAGADWRWAPENINKARIRGVTWQGEWRNDGWLLAANVTRQNPENRETQRQLIRRAKVFGTLSVGKQHQQWGWNVNWRASGRRFDDGDNQDKLSPYAVVDFSGQYAWTPQWTSILRVDNLFDREYQTAKDYASVGRRYYLGLRYQMK